MQTEQEQVAVEELQNAEAPEEQNEKKPTNWKKELVSWIFTLGAAVIAALVIRTFIFEPIRVDGSSMADTLQDGEVMVVTKPEYLLGDPEFGDVVICKYPGRTENFVKRVMGVPGDHDYCQHCFPQWSAAGGALPDTGAQRQRLQHGALQAGRR